MAAVILLAVPARADVPAAPPSPAGVALHLDDALALALRQNFDVLSAGEDTRIADAGLHAAREWPNPSVSGLSSRIHLSGGDGTELGNDLWAREYDNVLQIAQPYELGGLRHARQLAASASVDAARAQLADLRRTLEDDVVEAYAGAALAEANARIAHESAGYLRDEARIAEVRWRSGDISRSDLDQIEIAASRFDLDAHSAASTAFVQRLALERLLGEPAPVGAIELADSLETLVERTTRAVPLHPAAGVRPDLAAANAESRRADAALDLERSKRVPEPTLLFQVEHEPPVRSNSVGVGLALTLPLWNLNGGSIAAARASRDQARHAAARAAASVAADLAAAQRTYDEATARWQVYRDELRPRSETVRRSVSLAYEKGGASLVDLLGAQRSDNEIRLATMQAASDEVIAAARLRAAMTTTSMEVR